MYYTGVFKNNDNFFKEKLVLENKEIYRRMNYAFSNFKIDNILSISYLDFYYFRNCYITRSSYFIEQHLVEFEQ